MFAKWVDEHGRLPKQLGAANLTEAQLEERKEEMRLAIFLNREQPWISKSGAYRWCDEPYPEDRRRELQAVPLLADRLHKWDKMRESLEERIFGPRSLPAV